LPKQTTENETDFCESYKFQILGKKEEKKSLLSTVLKLLTILILLVLIVVISLYGYPYFINDKKNDKKLESSVLPPVSLQVSEEETISDEDLVVKLEEPKKVNTTEEPDINTIANAIKIEIAKSEIKEEQEKLIKTTDSIVNSSKEEISLSQNEESLDVPTTSTSAPEAQYLEELADLSREIDKEQRK